MIDLLLRATGVAMAPLVALLIFTLQEGHRWARLAKRAKTAAELVNLTPPESPLYPDLAAHHEQAVTAFLAAQDARVTGQRDWFVLRTALIPGVITILLTIVVWAAMSAPEDRPAWMMWLTKDAPANPRAAWVDLVVGVIPFLAWTLGLCGLSCAVASQLPPPLHAPAGNSGSPR